METNTLHQQRYGIERAAGHTPTISLYRAILAHGPIKTVRASSAKARGRAKDYAYWGAALYEIRATRDGVANVAVRGAFSDRRSFALALDDACATGRLYVDTIGALSDLAIEEKFGVRR